MLTERDVDVLRLPVPMFVCLFVFLSLKRVLVGYWPGTAVLTTAPHLFLFQITQLVIRQYVEFCSENRRLMFVLYSLCRKHARTRPTDCSTSTFCRRRCIVVRVASGRSGAGAQPPTPCSIRPYYAIRPLTSRHPRLLRQTRLHLRMRMMLTSPQ